jgi:PAS domain S-box-containing protein
MMMHWHYTPYIIPVLVTATVSVGVSVYAWRHRAATGATAFVLLTLAVAEWLLGYALWLMSDEPWVKVLWVKVEYVSITSLPLVWLAFAFQYTGRREWLARRRLASLAAVPLVTLLLAWTNEAHGLLWTRFRFYPEGDLLFSDVSYGAWFWVHAAYSYLCLLVGTGLMVLAALRSPQLYRRQAVALLVGALIPWLGNVLYVFRLSPVPNLDLTPFSFALAGLVIAWALFRFRLFDLVPVARHTVVEGMSDGMIVVDAENRIVDLNPAARSIVGPPAARAIGLSVARVLSPWPDWVERILAGAEAQAEISLGQDEAQCHYDLRVSPLADRLGRLTGRLIVLRDITERVRAEEALHRQALELQARNEELDAFASTVAHDLINPLGVIIGFADILQESCAAMPAEDLRGHLRTIAQNGSKMRSIIDALLLLATVRKGEVETETLDMASVVSEALLRLALMIKEYQAEVVVPQSWPAALGYGPWVEEVWVNYISNALKYGGRPPLVELGATVPEEADGMVRFWVCDNGPGLAPEDQTRLFTPFTRLDHDRVQGHGLGLSIVRRIVEKLGGQVGVESQLNQGAVFSFTLHGL